MTENNELYHYGVPGMRWGRRKGQNQSSSKSMKTTKVDIKNMSDDELRKPVQEQNLQLAQDSPMSNNFTIPRTPLKAS